MTVEIYRMTEADAAEAERLEKSCFPDPRSLATIEADLQNPNYRAFAAKDEGRLIGYAFCYLAADELNITSIAVDWACRRQGIGTALLKTLMQFASGSRATSIYLEVRESNEAAIALYRKLGFEGNSRRKNYYDNPKEDAILLHYYLED